MISVLEGKEDEEDEVRRDGVWEAVRVVGEVDMAGPAGVRMVRRAGIFAAEEEGGATECWCVGWDLSSSSLRPRTPRKCRWVPSVEWQ